MATWLQLGCLSHAAAAAKSLQSCPTLCNPRDGSPPGTPVPGILQARTLEWVAISFSNAWKWKVKGKSLSRIRLLATPWTGSPPGFSVHGILQARVLEWGAIAFSSLSHSYFIFIFKVWSWAILFSFLRRTSFNISCKASLLVTHFLNFCLRKSLFLNFWKIISLDIKFWWWYFFFQHFTLILLKWFLKEICCNIILVPL